ncbi:MAG: diacylglycerol/lipid kinase family protein [Dermatophilaceae bacterium]
MTRRGWAVAAVASFLAVLVTLALMVLAHPLASLVVVALVVASGWCALQGLTRRGPSRRLALGAAAVLLLGAIAVMVGVGQPGEGLIAVGLLALSLAAGRRALRPKASWPAAERPRHPVVVWNARSGGGKAVRFRLADESRARGIEPLELTPGTDLLELLRRAVDDGADALAAAGGDGTQALVAAVAAQHGLPFACIPAGTRNHFALDLGVDRDDVVGALDAFVDGRERVVDLAEINGRVFVNNCSLGIYAEAVQRQGYRDAKLRTILDTAPDVLGPSGSSAVELEWTSPDGRSHPSATVILVSNDVYRLGRALGTGTRPRLDDGLLGVAVLRTPADRSNDDRRARPWEAWTAEEFEVRSSMPVHVGVDGEALTLDPPLRFVTRPGVLRVRIAAHHPGASPSSVQPDTITATLALVWHLATGRRVLPEALQ